jgi:hypothetical protein
MSMKNSNDTFGNRTRDLSANELRHRVPPFFYKSYNKDIDQATFYIPGNVADVPRQLVMSILSCPQT